MTWTLPGIVNAAEPEISAELQEKLKNTLGEMRDKMKSQGIDPDPVNTTSALANASDSSATAILHQCNIYYEREMVSNYGFCDGMLTEYHKICVADPSRQYCNDPVWSHPKASVLFR